MKKIVAIVSSLVLVLAMGIMLAACSSNAAGTYKFESLKVTQGDTVIQEMKAGEDSITADYIVYELKDDGTFTMGTLSGKWTQDGKKITLTMGSESSEGTLSGGTLTFTEERDGIKSVSVFKKA